MRRAVAIEFRKMHRLRSLPLLIGMVVAVAALSSASQFAGSTRAGFDDPGARPWAALLLGYTLMAAMTSPILTAVIASRQTDIEHQAGGWILAAGAGRTAGELCRAKLVALAVLLVPAVLIQSLLVVAAGYAAGIRVPVEVGPWALYTLLLYLVDVAFCALHVWLAARVENQLISVGVGMLGAFLAVFSLLLPSIASRAIPWGYYAVISQAGQSDAGVDYVASPLGWIAGFLVVVAAAFALATVRLDRVER
ncbi:ABC transporter permease [Clavibacter sp. VKM Ac-2872]|uniref:ABC transporter permease n=1 Tax=Clavibacter sp. VKM Ac-2872 TaxID=2783812 RepID=UPI00188B9353|nr:ABC transporter permease [Clavibacter sp. VKM Ac-2872]